MSASGRWRRIDAEHWVHVLGMVLTAVLGLWTVVAVFGGLVVGAVWLALLPAGLTALVAAMTSAWQRERPWSWWAWATLGVLQVLLGLGGLLTGRAPWIDGASTVYGGLLLVLLSHPDSRARIDAPAPARRPPSHGVADRSNSSGDTRTPRW